MQSTDSLYALATSVAWRARALNRALRPTRASTSQVLLVALGEPGCDSRALLRQELIEEGRADGDTRRARRRLVLRAGME